MKNKLQFFYALIAGWAPVSIDDWRPFSKLTDSNYDEKRDDKKVKKYLEQKIKNAAIDLTRVFQRKT